MPDYSGRFNFGFDKGSSGGPPGSSGAGPVAPLAPVPAPPAPGFGSGTDSSGNDGFPVPPHPEPPAPVPVTSEPPPVPKAPPVPSFARQGAVPPPAPSGPPAPSYSTALDMPGTDSGTGSDGVSDDAGPVAVPAPEPTSTRLTPADLPARRGPVPKPEAFSELSDKKSYTYIPKNLVDAVMRMIPNAKNRNDAVTTYLYLMMGREPAVDEKIKALADCYSDDNGMSDLQGQVKRLEAMISGLNAVLANMAVRQDELMTMLTWLVGERIHCGINLNTSAERMDFLFPEHEVIRVRASQQADEYRQLQEHMRQRAKWKEISAQRDGRN